MSKLMTWSALLHKSVPVHKIRHCRVNNWLLRQWMVVRIGNHQKGGGIGNNKWDRNSEHHSKLQPLMFATPSKVRDPSVNRDLTQKQGECRNHRECKPGLKLSSTIAAMKHRKGEHRYTVRQRDVSKGLEHHLADTFLLSHDRTPTFDGFDIGGSLLYLSSELPT